MSVEIIQERLAAYACRSTLEEEQALREITQEILLAGLGRTDFFGRAGFQGGTCLRIFHSLNRFSEDMDFALAAPDPTFELPPYLDQLRQELSVYELLSAALNQQGPWQDRAAKTDDAWCVEQLRAMIAKADWVQARRDVQRFVRPHDPARRHGLDARGPAARAAGDEPLRHPPRGAAPDGGLR